MEDLGIVGISWQKNGSESLDRYTLPRNKVVQRLRALAKRAELAELAYLATCNRVEVIFAHAAGTQARDIRPLVYELLTGEKPRPGEAERALRAWGGEGAVEHLFLVAAGLDSACLGETEIVGQVRNSSELSIEIGLSGPRLKLLFEESLKIAGRVRGETQLGEGRVSLAELAVDHIRERIRRTPGQTALIGISPMTERAAQSLASTKTPFIIINRSLDKAQILADRFGCLCLPLNEFCRKPPRIEAVFSCTGSSHAIIKESTLERLAAQTESGQAPLLIDMSVPADIDPVACTKLALKRIGMDEITKEAQANRLVRLNKTPQARELVDYALIRFHEKFAEQVYGELFGVLQQRYQHTAKEGVQRLLKKELKDLGPKQREAIESWSRVLARRFAHIPTLGLRGLLYEGPEGSLDAFLEGLDPKFASELRSAVNRGLQQQEETGP